MSRSIQLHSHSFRLLLYLEWILLGIVALFEFQPEHTHESLQFPLLTILSLAGFGVMGLRLPKEQLIYKVFYTGLEFALILLPILYEPWMHSSPFLYLIVVIRSCLMFRPQGRLIVTGLAFVSFLIVLFFRYLSHPPKSPLEHFKSTLLILRLNAAFSFGLILIFLLLLINALLAERQSREQLLIANEQLRQYAQRIEDQATLQERNRIAREIHDSLGHSLTAQSIQLENALMFWHSNAEKAQEFLLEAKRLGLNALQEVRQSIVALHANPLQGQSLEAAIRSLIKEYHQTTGIMPDCTISLTLPLPSEVSTAIYRIVKEALANVYKHSDATQVMVHLLATAQTLSLIVEDNGRGFNLEQNTAGFGLQGMRERAVALGGQFNITSTLEAGCRIVVYVPLPRSNSSLKKALKLTRI